MPGGGSALLHASKTLDAVREQLTNFDQRIGVGIIQSALKVRPAAGRMAAGGNGGWRDGAAAADGGAAQGSALASTRTCTCTQHTCTRHTAHTHTHLHAPTHTLARRCP